jgi:hypothetical protein
MKKVIFILALVLSGVAINTASAQLRIGLNINIGSQPIWGPVGYDHVDYYYMPDIDVYYNVPNRQYVYQERGRWIFASSLPARYRNYDLYSGYKVVVNEQYPYRHAAMYRTKYAAYKNNHDQQVIRNSHEEKYFQIKEHPEHNKWKEDKGPKDDKRDNHDNGNQKNKGKGKGRD